MSAKTKMKKFRLQGHKNVLSKVNYLLVVLCILFCTERRLLAAFTYVINTPTATIVPYGGSYTYSVTWTGGTYNYNSSANYAYVNFLYANGVDFNYDAVFPGAYTFTQTFTDVDSGNDGYYYLNINTGSSTISTTNVYLYISPGIVTQPQNTICVSGSSTTMGMVAGPSTATFQWFNAATGLSINSAGSSPAFTPTTANNGQTVFCKISNTYGTTNSANVILTVGVAPTISSQPASVVAVFGSNATFSVTISGTSTLPVTYQWYKDGTAINEANLSSITITPITPADLGAYQVVITNLFGSVTSSSASLSGTAPAITAQPTKVSTTFGSSVTFSVTATGSQPLYYQWYKDGEEIPGANLSYIYLPSVTNTDAGIYAVIISNEIDQVISSNATLAVGVAPTITNQPQSQTVIQGQTVIFTVGAASPTPLSYQWFENGSKLFLATNATYGIANVQTFQVGTYTVVVSNLAGSVTSANAVLIVNAPPLITTQPQSQNIAVGNSVTFSVVLNGTTPFGYEWLTNGVMDPSGTNSYYSLSNVGFANAGSYVVVVTNIAGSVTSTPAILVVGYPPVLTNQPQSQEITQGQTAIFAAGATGTVPLNYQWIENGSALTGITNSIFAISNAQGSDSGTYSVTVFNLFGSTSSTNAVLTVDTPPVITTQPASLNVPVGGNAAFTVAATGSQPLQYQWFNSGGGILNATNSTYAIADVSLGQADNYYVVVTNFVASVTSSVAMLAVGYPPAISTNPVSQTNAFGSTAVFSCTATGPLPMNYQWFQNSTNLISETNGTLILTNLQVTNAGSYQVIVGNAFGSITSLVAILHVSPGMLTQPTNQIVMQGTPAGFMAMAGGEPPLTYQWQLNGTNLTDNSIYSGSTSKILNLVGALTNTVGSYTLVVSNDYGSITSAVVTLSFGFQAVSSFNYTGYVQPYVVPAGVTQLWFSITGGGGANGTAGYSAGQGGFGGSVQGIVSANQYETLTLSVGAGGSGTNGGTSPLSGYAGGNGGNGLYAGGGGAAATVVIMSDGGSIICGGGGGGGSGGGSGGSSGGSGGASIIVSATNSQTQGGNASGEDSGGGGGGAAAGSGGPGALNPAGGAGFAGGGAGFFPGVGGGGAGGSFLPANYLYASYTWQYTNLPNAGQNGSISIVANPIPYINQQPALQTTIAGSSAQFNVAVSSPVPLSYQWFMNGAVIPNGTNSSLQFTAVTPQDAGSYFVVITNAYASVTSSVVSLTVNIPAYITSEPQDQSVLQGSGATFTVVATGTPSLGYQWYQQLDTVATATPIVADGFVLGATVTSGGAGYFTPPNVSISGGGGSGASATATVNSGAVTAINIINPGSDYTSLPTISIEPPFAPLNGQTNANLNITPATTNDAGNYFVVVSNNYGAATSSIVALTVNVPVYIITQPQSVTVPPGSNASFSVTAGGNTPFSYQWYALPATNTTATATALVLDGFVYGATVNNGGNGYVSIPNVQILGGGGSGASATAVVSNEIVVAITVTNTGSGYASTPLIQIDPPSAVNLTGSTNQVLNISGVTTNNAGSYFVVVTNNYGNVTSTQVVLTVVTGVGLPPQTFTIRFSGGNGVQLQMLGSPNFPYTVQFATNLVQPIQWQPLFTTTANTNGMWQFTDTNLNSAQKFYRMTGP